jgi:hypothetical protein
MFLDESLCNVQFSDNVLNIPEIDARACGKEHTEKAPIVFSLQVEERVNKVDGCSASDILAKQRDAQVG